MLLQGSGREDPADLGELSVRSGLLEGIEAIIAIKGESSLVQAGISIRLLERLEVE